MRGACERRPQQASTRLEPAQQTDQATARVCFSQALQTRRLA
jgi:hypothetical protein